MISQSTVICILAMFLMEHQYFFPFFLSDLLRVSTFFWVLLLDLAERAVRWYINQLYHWTHRPTKLKTIEIVSDFNNLHCINHLCFWSGWEFEFHFFLISNMIFDLIFFLVFWQTYWGVLSQNFMHRKLGWYEYEHSKLIFSDLNDLYHDFLDLLSYKAA